MFAFLFAFVFSCLSSSGHDGGDHAYDVVCVCLFSCLSGSGRDVDAHVYRSSDSEHVVLNIFVFIFMVWRMRSCCVVSLCFVYAVCGVWDLIGMFMFIACKVVRYQNVCDHRKAESRIYV